MFTRPECPWSSSKSSGPPACSIQRSPSSRSRTRSTKRSSYAGNASRRQERVLITTLTKRTAEDLSDYLRDVGLKVRYLHSDIDTIERVEILRGLRAAEFDILVGINLLREGLDLPEVSLVCILDADKEGFLRSQLRSFKPPAAPRVTSTARWFSLPIR